MRFALAFVLAVTAFPARGAPPDYDVKGLCVHQASAMIGLTHEISQSVLKDCYREQQGAYDALKRIWSEVPEDIQTKNDAAAKSQNASGGFGDYDVLKYLILSDMQKLKDTEANKNFQLKR